VSFLDLAWRVPVGLADFNLIVGLLMNQFRKKC
jgi:hypothetical protein